MTMEAATSAVREPARPRLPLVSVEAASDLPTRHGPFRMYVFTGDGDSREHVALVRGDLWGAEDVLARVHSECMTGDVFGSLRCDCGEQLDRALARIGREGRGVLLYLRQEGRGIGLANKIRAYRLQQEDGLDTVDANLALGFPDDARDYGVAAAIVRTLGVRSVALMTNNPDKVRQLASFGIVVSSRLPHVVVPGEHNRSYLSTKAARSGHLIDLDRIQRSERREGEGDVETEREGSDR